MSQPQIIFRCFQTEDIPELLRIQNDNLRINLSQTDQANGYLSVDFSAQQFQEMHNEIPIIVADLGAGLGGYLCSSSLQYSSQVPLLAHMIGLFNETTYRNRPLGAFRCFVYGPVCIDRALRGSGLLNGMFEGLMGRVAGRFDVGTLFISSDNPRSLYAHVHHLGMQELRSFTFDENDFFLLAFDVPERQT
jgi:hypothetical protein